MSRSFLIRSIHKPIPFLAIAILVAAFGAGSICHAQDTNEPAVGNLALTKAPATGSQPQPADPAISQTASAPASDGWHVSFAPYLWFPGVHGTVGAQGKLTSVHASATDLLSNFRFGLMGTAELRKNRFVMPMDLMWVRLGDDTGLPVNELGATSADVKVDEFLLTPKIGYELVRMEKFEVAALAGFRYWHLGQNVKFNPSGLGLNFSSSQNWASPLVGGRIVTPLSRKIDVTIAGDVGGWDVGSQLEYQAVGLIGYQVNARWALEVGYRYLDVNWRGSGAVFDAAMSGIVFGMNINVK
jgi:hypothetical protein